jgi:hypothetical protein
MSRWAMPFLCRYSVVDLGRFLETRWSSHALELRAVSFNTQCEEFGLHLSSNLALRNLPIRFTIRRLVGILAGTIVNVWPGHLRIGPLLGNKSVDKIYSVSVARGGRSTGLTPELPLKGLQ